MFHTVPLPPLIRLLLGQFIHQIVIATVLWRQVQWPLIVQEILFLESPARPTGPTIDLIQKRSPIHENPPF